MNSESNGHRPLRKDHHQRFMSIWWT